MADASKFSGLVPGFEFLQGLVKNASAALPTVGQWIAPTLDPSELDKRISELRTVQYWLEQNSRMLATTIQALEVQRMTLSTLQTMNVSLGDLSDALKVKPAASAPVPAPPPPAATPEPEAEPATAEPAPAPQAPPAAGGKPRPRAEAPGAAAKATTGAIDPMQWWGALTQQFADLAGQALRDATAASPAAASAAAAPAPKAAAKGAKAAAGRARKKPAAKKKPAAAAPRPQ